MTSTLSLASRLAALSDAELVELIERRRLVKTRLDDFFDLAEALLDAPSVQHALATLERPTLAVLAAFATARPVDQGDAGTRPHLEELADRALIEPSPEGYALYEPVRERLAAWPSEGLPSAAQLIDDAPPAALAAIGDVDPELIDQYAAERAFQTVGAFAELLAELDRDPARELQKGGLSLPDGRRLAAVMAIDVEAVPTVIWLAERAQLIARDGSTWLTTDEADPWLAGSTSERWQSLAAAWHGTLPASIRGLLLSRAHTRWGSALHETLSWYYPAAGEPLVRQVERFEASAELLGISARDVPSSAGAALLENGPAAAAAAITALLPQEVDKVYLQHDLSIVSPGPLAPAVDGHLRRLADVESRALASTYRVTSSSIERAIGAGETAESLRAFLTGISLTGIPQPLDYLITESAARYGLVRVRDTGHDGQERTLIHSTDADIIGQIAVDQVFGPLALRRIGPGEIVTRFAQDIVYWALADARYPAAAEDAAGRIIGVRKRHAPPTDAIPVVDRAGQLVRHLRDAASSQTTDDPKAWLTRQLEAAVRGKVTLIVTVGMPGGAEQDFLLEPTGVGGGRLRGRDRKSDIERTLPLSSIRGVRTP